MSIGMNATSNCIKSLQSCREFFRHLKGGMTHEIGGIGIKNPDGTFTFENKPNFDPIRGGLNGGLKVTDIFDNQRDFNPLSTNPYPSGVPKDISIFGSPSIRDYTLM